MYEKTVVPAIGIAKHEPLETPWNRFSPESMPSKIPRSYKDVSQKTEVCQDPLYDARSPKTAISVGLD